MNKRISELDFKPTPSIGDSLVLVSSGTSKRTSVGATGLSILSSNFPITSSGIQVNGDVNIDGNLTVSTLVSASILYESGSTLFGNSSDDTHIFTGSVSISGSINNVDYIDFNTSSLAPGTPGRLQWNDVDGTLDLTLKNGNVTLQMGQESHIRAYNASGVPLLESENKAVYISGSTSQFPAVNLADNLTRQASENTVGIVTENIGTGEVGYITTFGMVRNIDMSSFQPGDTLYLGGSDGILVNQPPTPPALTVIMGYCIDNSTSGSMFVNVRSGFEYPQYAIAYNLSNHTASLANTETLIGFDTPQVLSGISLVDGSKFTVSTPGLYEFTLICQVNRAASSGTSMMYFWMKKNGENVPHTNNNLSTTGNANQVATLFSRNLVIVLEAGDYVEFYWATDDTDMVLKYTAAGTSPIRPDTPAVKVTATRIS